MINEQTLRVIDEIDALRKTHEDSWQVPREEADMLLQIALATGAKLIVEVGTSYGFSGLHWALAAKLNGGHVHTIDASEKKVLASRQAFDRAGLGEFITNHHGDARQKLAEIAGPIDLAFIDADKPSCGAYFDLLWPKLSPGGSILTDNATTHRQQLADFVRHVRGLDGAISREVAIGNGIEWTIKLAK